LLLNESVISDKNNFNYFPSSLLYLNICPAMVAILDMLLKYSKPTFFMVDLKGCYSLGKHVL